MTGPAAPGPPPGPAAPGWPVVVVGLMGSGKTSAGRRVAQALRVPLRDSDEELAARYGESAADQVARVGADVLHEREAAQLREALGDARCPVIAAAASVVDDPACRAALAPAFVVWLDAPAKLLADRMRDGDHRPHYDPDLEKMLTDQYRRRAPHYRALADLTIDVSDTGPEDVARQVVAAISPSI